MTVEKSVKKRSDIKCRRREEHIKTTYSGREAVIIAYFADFLVEKGYIPRDGPDGAPNKSKFVRLAMDTLMKKHKAAFTEYIKMRKGKAHDKEESS